MILGLVAGALVTAGALLIALEHHRVKRVEQRWLTEHPDQRHPDHNCIPARTDQRDPQHLADLDQVGVADAVAVGGEQPWPQVGVVVDLCASADRVSPETTWCV